MLTSHASRCGILPDVPALNDGKCIIVNTSHSKPPLMHLPKESTSVFPVLVDPEV